MEFVVIKFGLPPRHPAAARGALVLDYHRAGWAHDVIMRQGGVIAVPCGHCILKKLYGGNFEYGLYALFGLSGDEARGVAEENGFASPWPHNAGDEDLLHTGWTSEVGRRLIR
jgi:hypothetical protein